ncbi:MAG: type III pantothenate kinase [Rickettsiales bacterium]|nr:type III pantothenate kinase [Rickettsiales bacterium]
MIITIDIGNTNITVVIYSNEGQKSHEFRLITKKQRTSDELGLALKSFMDYNKITIQNIKAVIVASVVPAINDVFAYACEKYLSTKALFIKTKDGDQLKIPLNIKIDIPGTLGADRISNSVGAIARYGQTLIIFDFGTATVCEVICNGDYLGGMIIPGIDTAINALHREASLLPFYRFQKPKKSIPTSTDDALKAGIFYGTIGMVEKIIREVEQNFQEHNFKVIATGGLSSFLKEHVSAIDVYDSDLVNFGLYKIYMHNFR